MFTIKNAKKCFAVALLGLGMFYGCGNDESSTASTFSETDTGKPIAQLDTSLLASDFIGGSDCGNAGKTLARRVTIAWDEIACETRDERLYFIDTRVRVVDSKGKPMVGATVSFVDCPIGEDCEEITDEKGYVYADSALFLRYYFHKGKEDQGTHVYSELNLRVLSADGSLGGNVVLNYEDANVFFVDGKPVAELQAVAQETLYSIKVPLDTLIPYYETTLKSVGDLRLYQASAEIPEFLICVDGFPPCTEVTEEDRKNGYVIIHGLPEGSYSFRVGSVRFGLLHIFDAKLEVEP